MAATATGMSTVGATLKIAGTACAEVFNISGPSYSQTAVDTTHHTSASRFRTYVPGFSDAGEVSFDIRYVPTVATHDGTTGIVSLFGATAVTAFIVTFPDKNDLANDSQLAFNGIMTSFTPSADLDSSLDASCTIKISGKPVLTEATN